MAFCAYFQALVQIKNWFMRFPTILQPWEWIIEMLRGQYAHSVGCYNEAIFHYIEAVKVYIGYINNIHVIVLQRSRYSLFSFFNGDIRSYAGLACLR
jgi:F0F1-type ATP synthase membrane subunit a